MNRGTYKNCTTVKLGNLELESDWKTKRIFELGRSKEARKEQLKEFIYAKLRQRWLTISKAQATLERNFVQTLLNSI